MGCAQEILLRVENIEKYYGGLGTVTRALDQLSFHVRKGEYISIMGASGSGKTTLLNCLSTIDSVSAGHIMLDGKDITKLRRRSLPRSGGITWALYFRSIICWIRLLWKKIWLLPLTIRVWGRENMARVRKIADKLQIGDVLGKFPFQTSGGQKQRCAFARAVVCGPKIIFADEPTGALDSHSARVLLEIISQLHEDLETTVFMVTHDAFCASYAERTCF